MELIVNELGDYNIVDSGSAALDAFDAVWKAGLPFDVIFLNLSTPDMNGIEVVKNLRFLEKEKEIPKKAPAKIIMIALTSDKETVMDCFDAGCNNYIVKPVDKEIVTGKLKHHGFQINS